MGKLQYHFYEIDSDESFSVLAQALNTTCVNGIVSIPQSAGFGTIRKISLEKGLLMRVWDFELHQSLFLQKLAVPKGLSRTFHIGFILNPEALVVRRKDDPKGVKIQEGMNIIFVSSDIEIEVEIATEKGLHAIDISFTDEWLLDIFNGADEQFLTFVQDLMQKAGPIVFLESTNAADYRRLAELHATAKSTRDTLHIKAAALTLLSGFFSKLFNKSLSEVLNSKFFYQEKMLEVEKILASHLEKKLPSIDSIARQVAMSLSTLKRHFKLIYGKTIYEYYLELKMDYAKRLMLEKPLSVNEVATMLDYENVSNFIYMFKRYHGFAPGSLRRFSA